MKPGNLGRRVVPVAVAATLVGTALVGLAGGPMIGGAYAQRPDSKEDEDRRKRGQQRPEPRQTPATPQGGPRGGGQPGVGGASPPPQQRPVPARPERVEPQRPPPAAPRQVAPQPAPGPAPGVGRPGPGTIAPPQREVAPPPRRDAPLPRQVQPGPGGPRDKGPAPSGETYRPIAPGDPPGRDRVRRDEPPPPRGSVGEGRPPQAPGRGPETYRPVAPGDPPGRDRVRRDEPPPRGPIGEGRPQGPDRRGADTYRPIAPGDPPPFAGRGPRRLEDVKKGRVERVEEGGRRVIEEPGNRFIIREQGRSVIRRDEGRAFERFAPNARTRDIGEGRRETVIERGDGSRVYTEVDGNGRLLRRYRRDRSGREIVLIDNRRFYRNVGIGLGVTALGLGVGLALAPPAVSLPREKYIVEYERASDDDLYEALSAPPVQRLERPYSLEEIRYSRGLREYMRRIDLDTINFEFGSFEVAPDQYPKLERLARIIHRALRRNEAEVFLIEGHTDAVGSDDDNLTLSDRRAETVAEILISQFEVPVENLVTQGYGEQHLKVETEAPERLNRRVAFRRITPLLGLSDR